MDGQDGDKAIKSSKTGVSMPSKKSASTDDYDPSLFKQHGRVNYTREKQILICDAEGPFNRELIDAIINVSMDLIEAINADGKWADITIIRKSALASPESFQAFNDFFKLLGNMGIRSSISALVIDESVEGFHIMIPHFVKAYADAGINLGVFKKFSIAKVWVENQLELTNCAQ